MFGRANIIVPPPNATITTDIMTVDNYVDNWVVYFSAVQDQDCLDYVRFITCLVFYRPCPGSAWCGANSKHELRSAVIRACRCNRDYSCVVGMSTAEDTLIAFINLLPDYYVGSASTGPVGDSNAVCQDVSGKRHNLHACSLHCVVVELVIFILCVVVYLTFSLISHVHCLVTQIYLGPHAHDVLPCSIYGLTVSGSTGNMKSSSHHISNSVRSIALVAILFSAGLWLL